MGLSLDTETAYILLAKVSSLQLQLRAYEPKDKAKDLDRTMRLIVAMIAFKEELFGIATNLTL